ncbi:class I SAM-dependent methyltransferase [Paenibacillus sp. IB182496]|uniref:Class I SAM-dependent methyltransferase n=1 Tax=Paenibacillus sabuli TaxID=2772509 RepID=A0A927BQ37_9BACL|nr:class I SAM-dependent methyltransferase [Paenibacillus sabuli]
MGEWFEKSFGCDYPVIYRHRDWEAAAQEVEAMASWLRLRAGAAVLDVGCGMGRHALALAAAGYRVTGVDLSEELLNEARKHDSEKAVAWMRGDMRALPLPAASMEATVNFFTSFGYFEPETDNAHVLRELKRVLRPQGRCLIDFLNPGDVASRLVPYSERVDALTGWTIREHRRIEDGWVKKEIALERPGAPVRHYSERVRLYDLDWFEQAMAGAGLVLDEVRGDYDGRVYDPATSRRMILIGTVRG